LGAIRLVYTSQSNDLLRIETTEETLCSPAVPVNIFFLLKPLTGQMFHLFFEQFLEIMPAVLATSCRSGSTFSGEKLPILKAASCRVGSVVLVAFFENEKFSFRVF
jgi:hypothetical protein